MDNNMNFFRGSTFRNSGQFKSHIIDRKITFILTPSVDSANSYPNTTEIDKTFDTDQFNNDDCCDEVEHTAEYKRKYVRHSKVGTNDSDKSADHFLVNLVEPLIVDSFSQVDLVTLFMTYCNGDDDLGKYHYHIIDIPELNIINYVNDPNLHNKIIIENMKFDYKNHICNYFIQNGHPISYVSVLPPGKYSQFNITISRYRLNTTITTVPNPNCIFIDNKPKQSISMTFMISEINKDAY